MGAMMTEGCDREKWRFAGNREGAAARWRSLQAGSEDGCVSDGSAELARPGVHGRAVGSAGLMARQRWLGREVGSARLMAPQRWLDRVCRAGSMSKVARRSARWCVLGDGEGCARQ
ncbi:hypothetical protein AMTR_s00190p00046410 [Amborella trichopoda]|uniref:Uncharacterized protein n=1 Tax=Amborella trichopoda TaxID=13333 RepID=U5D893_AMBTC|nr:hypothetical protein AMTR_s00190p00046410 [Amborella trichopoda]